MMSSIFRRDIPSTVSLVVPRVITGVYAHHGCMLSAADAYMRDVKPFFVIDATADHSQEQHEMTCRLIPSLCGQNVTTSQMLAAMTA